MAQEDYWLPGFNCNVEEWDAKGLTYETLAICRTLALRAHRQTFGYNRVMGELRDEATYLEDIPEHNLLREMLEVSRFPSMGLGLRNSAGHYLDLISAIVGCISLLAAIAFWIAGRRRLDE
jgi:hypothetical protein